MEKRRPSYDLALVAQALGAGDTFDATITSLRDGDLLGFSRADVMAVMRTLQPAMFYKSMTTHADHRVWQDVYHVPARDLMLYVKVQAFGGRLRLMSFKEL